MDGTELNITDVAREVIRPLYNGTGEPDLTLVTVSIAGRQAGLYNCTVASIGFDNSTNQTTQIGSAFVSTFIDGQFPLNHTALTAFSTAYSIPQLHKHLQ